MRFKPWPRPEHYADTSRKRAAYLRRQRRERAALPLFAAAVAERQIPVAEEMVRRTAWWEDRQRDGRSRRAEDWRRVRARLFALDVPRRQAIRALWRVCPYPADPSYLGTLLHEIATDRIDPANSPWGSPDRLPHGPPRRRRPASRMCSGRSVGARSAAVPKPPAPTS